MLSINQIKDASDLSISSNNFPDFNSFKTCCLAIASFLLVTNNSKAFDLNGDGMSDVWQRHYNIANGARLQDPDSDGYANWQEEAFGTNPNSSLSRPEIKLIQTPEGFSVLIPTVAGVDFQVQMSTDLHTWTPVTLEENSPSIFEGTGSPVEVPLPRISDRAFFRTHAVAHRDLDKDKLNSLEERLLGLSDNNRDFDGDGMNDGWEYQYGFSPAISDDFNVDEDGDGYNRQEESEFGSNPFSGDYDADGLDDKAEGLYGLNPNLKDSDGDGIYDGAEFRWDIVTGLQFRLDRGSLDGNGSNNQYASSFRQQIGPGDLYNSDISRRSGPSLQKGFHRFTESEMLEWKVPSSQIQDARHFHGVDWRTPFYFANFELSSDPHNPFYFSLSMMTTNYRSVLSNTEQIEAAASLRRIYPLYSSEAKGELSFVTVGFTRTGEWLRGENGYPNRTAYEFIGEYRQDVNNNMPPFIMDAAIWEEIKNTNVFQRIAPNYFGQGYDLYKGDFHGECIAVHVTDTRVSQDGQQLNTVTPMRFGDTNLIFKAGSSHELQISAKHFVDDALWQHFTWSFDGLTGNATKTADGSSATVSIPSLDTAHTITLKLFDKVLWEWNVYPFEMVGKDAQENFAERKDELKIAKMQQSLDDTGNLNVDSDVDAVKIRIVGGARMESFTGKIGTLSAEGNVFDDLTAVSFEPSGQDLLTQGLILVQDVADDIYSGNVVGVDNTPNDKTHHAQLGGEFLFSSSEEDEKEFSRWTVPVKKEMNVNVVVLRENGIDSVSQEILGSHIISALNVYSQVGLKLNFNVQFADKPEGVDLSDGFEKASSNPKLPSREQEILIETLGTTNANDLTVFYVPNFTDDNVKGEAIYPLVFNSIQPRYQNNVFVSGNAQRIYTLAHEIGHVLTNQAHYEEDYPHTADYLPEYNLMTPQLGQVNGIDGSKRLTKEQEDMIFNNNNNFNDED